MVCQFPPNDLGTELWDTSSPCHSETFLTKTPAGQALQGLEGLGLPSHWDRELDRRPLKTKILSASAVLGTEPNVLQDGKADVDD